VVLHRGKIPRKKGEKTTLGLRRVISLRRVERKRKISKKKTRRVYEKRGETKIEAGRALRKKRSRANSEKTTLLFPTNKSRVREIKSRKSRHRKNDLINH